MHSCSRSLGCFQLYRKTARCRSVLQNLSQKARPQNTGGCVICALAILLIMFVIQASSIPCKPCQGEIPSRIRTELTHSLQKTESSGKDTLVLPGTERSVALKQEESEDPTLIHNSHDEVSDMLQTQVLQNSSWKFDVSLLHMFSVNQALWRRFMNSCLWETVHLGKDEDDFKRVIHKMEEQKDSDDLRNGASAYQQP